MKALEIILLLLIIVILTAIIYMGWENSSPAHLERARDFLRFPKFGG